MAGDLNYEKEYFLIALPWIILTMLQDHKHLKLDKACPLMVRANGLLPGHLFAISGDD